MKIVHLTSVHSAFDVRIFHKECKSLADAGLQVTVVAPHAQDESAGRVHIRAIPPVNGRLPRMTITMWNVLRESLRQQADLYHFHDPELIPVGLILRALGKKVIYDIHEDVPKDVFSKGYLPLWSRRTVAWMLDRVESSASKRFSALVAATPSIAARFREQNPQTVLVQNFPDVAEIAVVSPPPWQTRPLEIAYIGGVRPDRGIREMVQAMGLLPPESRVSLAIASLEDPLEILSDLAQEPGWEYVRYLGYLSRPEIFGLLGRVRAGMVLFHPEPNHVESMPHKLFEYLAAGLPVIASDFPFWREMLGPTGAALFVDPRSPEAVAQAIEYVVFHPEQAEQMGRRGQAAARELFNWRTQASELLKLYGTLTEPVCAA